MGKLVTVMGNAGVGKTTLTRRLCDLLPLNHALEEHAERPFQALFAADLQRYALANQIDYLLLRAEQESALRQQNAIGIQDGGLDQDFFIFTRFFYRKGYLTADEYQLCQRLYTRLRQSLPPPDLTILLTAPLDVIIGRHVRRSRSLEIATTRDLVLLQELVDDWQHETTSARLVTVNASADDPTFSGCLTELVITIQSLIDP